MPIRLTDKDAQWSQDEENIYLQLPLKGANRKRLDIYLNDVYLKVNYPPYLFEVDLWAEVQPTDSTTTIQDGYINIQLRKPAIAEWPALKSQLSTDQVLQRRQQAVERQQNQFNQARQQQDKQKFQQEQEMVQKLIDAERNERARIVQLKMEERQMAENDLKGWIMESTVADGKDGSDEQLKAVGSAQLATIRLTGKDTKRPPPPRQYGMIQVHFTNNTVNDHPARDRDSAEDATSASY